MKRVPLHRWAPFVIVPAAVAVAVAVGFGFIAKARGTIGAFGLPLDDAWIHLTYARTLAESGRFAYFDTAPATQGSTSPLYTLLLAFLWRFMPDEKFLSYGVGMATQGMFLALLVPWAMHRTRSLPLGLAAGALLALDGSVALLSVSGMETNLFLAAVAAVFVSRAEGRFTVAGAAAGAAAWVRPEGILLALVLLLDGLLPWGGGRSGERRRGALRPSRRTLLVAAGAAAVGIGSWAAFNLAVGGSIVPNTLAAKTAFYATNSRADFLREDLLGTVFRAGWIVLAPGALWAAIDEVLRLARGRAGRLRAEMGWIVALPLAYLVFLPYGHRFGRYLLPILPAIAVLGLAGWRDLFARLVGRRAGLGVFAVAAAAIAAQGASLPGAAREYASFCEYHLVRHERTGRWLAANTPAIAVVATHDVGAIGFYSRRRIVDTVGVVDRAPVAHLREPGYLAWLADHLEREGVTHLAVLRNWLPVSNVEPLFVADPRPEILEVYPFVPGKTHLVLPEAGRLEGRAAERLAEGRTDDALALLDRSLAIDPENARAWLLRGGALESVRRLEEAGEAYRRALDLDPGSAEIAFRLAANLGARGAREEALALAKGLLERSPPHPRAEALYRALGGP